MSSDLLNKVGIVVIGRNEGERLEKCLESIVQYKKNTIYVDSDSQDNSVDIAKTLGVRVVELKAPLKMSAALARNSGVELLLENENIEYIQLVDADCEIHRDWINQAVNHLESNKTVGAVCGRLREKFISKSLYNRLADMSWYMPPGEINSCGGIALVRSNIFKRGVFLNPEIIAGEEPEFYRRVKELGFKINCLPLEMATHDSAMYLFSQWWTRNVKTGFGYGAAKEWGGFAGQERSIFIWALFIPILVIVMCVLYLPLLAVILIYPLQIFRIALKLNKPYSLKDRFTESTFMLFSKFPQLAGLYLFKRKLEKDMEYKS